LNPIRFGGWEDKIVPSVLSFPFSTQLRVYFDRLMFKFMQVFMYYYKFFKIVYEKTTYKDIVFVSENL
jgi:hypothetical protein